MEIYRLCAWILVLWISCVAAESDENLTCCPPSYYIFEKMCWNPETNVTQSIRPVCDDVIKLTRFNATGGKITIKHSDLYTQSINPSQACYGNGTRDRNLTRVRSVALVCVTKEEEEAIVDGRTLGYCSIASVVFLGLTAIIYAVFSELRDLFGKSVINFCGSLAIALGIYSIMTLMTYEDMTSCAIRGFLAYFFLMAAFFWTNSIAIQVLRDTRRPASADYGWREFKWYMLYSWGLPTVLTTIMAVVNFHPGDHDRPGIGLNHCWFLSIAQQWYYMYSVMTILLVINLAIFIYIATIVWRFSFQSSHLKTLKFKLSMTIRLIVLLGLPWIFEMISSAVGEGYVILAIVNVMNSLQGVLVFLVLVVRKRVVKVLHQRGLLGCCSGLVEKWLAVGDEADANVVQHTDVHMQDDHHTDGRIYN